MNHQPTDPPRGDRRTVRVILPMLPLVPATATVEDVLRAAAGALQSRGLHHGDYVAGALDNFEDAFPKCLRPMSVVGAIRYAATGNPQRTSQLADQAVGFLALSLDGGPDRLDLLSLESHVEAWSDDATTDAVVAFLELAATAPECAA